MVINSISGRVFSDALPDICNFQSLLSNMKIFKLQYLGICLLLVVGISVTNAAVFKSVSGRFFRDYTINQVTHDQVEVLHADGCTWLPHEELPSHILRQYARDIEQKKSRYNRRFEAAIREKIEQARHEETSQQAVTMLLEIKKQYPSHPLIKEVDELIAAKGKEVAWEKNFITICSSGSIEEQIFQLQSLRDENPEADKNIVSKITAAIESRKKSLQDSVNRITAAISAASAQEDHEQAIAGLKSVLKKYPAYPIFEQQQSYLDKVNQLIADREQILAEERQKISDRLTSFVEKNPDIQEQLKNFFMHDDSDMFDRQLGENVLHDTLRLSDAVKFSYSQNPETAIRTLEKSLISFQYAVNKNLAIQLKKHKEKLSRRARENARLLDQIGQIRIEENGNGPFVIKKNINKHRRWSILLLLPEQQEDVEKMKSLFNKSIAYLKENGQEQLAWIEPLKDAVELLGKTVENALQKKDEISSNSCSIYNLETPVLIMAYEVLEDGLGHCNVWYQIYTPGQSNNVWVLE